MGQRLLSLHLQGHGPQTCSPHRDATIPSSAVSATLSAWRVGGVSPEEPVLSPALTIIIVLNWFNQLKTILMSSQTAGGKSFLRSLRKINASEPKLSSGIKGTLRGASVTFPIFSAGCVLQSFSSPHNTEGHLGQESGSNEFTFRGSSYWGP